MFLLHFWDIITWGSLGHYHFGTIFKKSLEKISLKKRDLNGIMFRVKKYTHEAPVLLSVKIKGI